MNLIPMLSMTVLPSLILLGVAYPLRGQGGRIRPRPVPVRRIRARLHNDRKLGLIPADEWGGVDRPTQWTVRPAEQRTAVTA